MFCYFLLYSEANKLYVYVYIHKTNCGASIIAQLVKNLPAMQETQVWLLGQKIPWRRKWQLTPVFLPGESHEQRSLADYSPWDRKSRTWLSDKNHHQNQLYSNKNKIQYPNKKNFKKQRKKPNLRPSPLGHTWFLLLTECPLCQWQLVLSMALTNSCHLGQGDYIVPSIFHCGKGKNFASPEYMHFMLIDLLSCILFLFTGQSMPYLLPRYQTKRGSAHLDTVKLTYWSQVMVRKGVALTVRPSKEYGQLMFKKLLF